MMSRLSGAIVQEVLPDYPVNLKMPNFGCSAFTMKNPDSVMMGRNYDFKNDTSSMLVYCSPKDGYRSVAFAALDNVGANNPELSDETRLATLLSPFISLDGINEKGVSIAVLTLDSTWASAGGLGFRGSKKSTPVMVPRDWQQKLLQGSFNSWFEDRYRRCREQTKRVQEDAQLMEHMLTTAQSVDGKEFGRLLKDLRQMQNSFDHEFLVSKEDQEFHSTYDTILRLGTKALNAPDQKLLAAE